MGVFFFLPPHKKNITKTTHNKITIMALSDNSYFLLNDELKRSIFTMLSIGNEIVREYYTGFDAIGNLSGKPLLRYETYLKYDGEVVMKIEYKWDANGNNTSEKRIS